MKSFLVTLKKKKLIKKNHNIIFKSQEVTLLLLE